jgi:hypothetical protein
MLIFTTFYVVSRGSSLPRLTWVIPSDSLTFEALAPSAAPDFSRQLVAPTCPANLSRRSFLAKAEVLTKADLSRRSFLAKAEAARAPLTSLANLVHSTPCGPAQKTLSWGLATFYVGLPRFTWRGQGEGELISRQACKKISLPTPAENRWFMEFDPAPSRTGFWSSPSNLLG